MVYAASHLCSDSLATTTNVQKWTKVVGHEWEPSRSPRRQQHRDRGRCHRGFREGTAN